MGPTLPAEAVDAVMGMGQDESVLILIKHCQKMKQQETFLRLITLLLLLSCTALFIFTIRNDISWENTGSSEQRSTVEQHSAYSVQGRLCPADNPQTNVQRLHIHLRSVPTDNMTDELYMKWDVKFGEKYNEEKSAIVIPERGFYFIYVRITLLCQEEDGDAEFRKFYMELHKWSEGYNKTVPLTEAWEGITCTSEWPRSVFVGQLFDLLEGDHVSVWIEEGYKLIIKSSFGAYLT